MTTSLERPRQLASDPSLQRFDSVEGLLPHLDNPTPLVRLRRVIPPEVDAFLKLEWFNPFGSIKDRAAAYLLDGLRQRGQLAGRRLVEASSGNTAIALAALAALEGIGVIITIPDGVPDEKKVLLRMLGAEVWPTPDDLCPVDSPRDGAIALARSIVESAGGDAYVWPDQYSNPDNVRAHYETTGPEVWRQTQGQVRTLVAGLGTSGTLSGAGRYLKEQDPSIRIVAVEPQPGHRLPGLKSLGEAKAPAILDWSVIDQVVRVDDEPAYYMTKRLFREEALMVGPSTGAVVDAIAQLDDPGLTVGISPDSGLKYTSFFAEMLGEEGKPKI
ncbi:MAG TPA: cysteine synthase family protein [Acidimicrobiia bacterium]|nr:cysteine synthase family protein [Acidimicrobiia bacterium]